MHPPPSCAARRGCGPESGETGPHPIRPERVGNRPNLYSSSASPTAASATPGATPACVSFATTVARLTMSSA